MDPRYLYWRVVIENGPGNVNQFMFCFRPDAELLFSSSKRARILLSPDGHEIKSSCGGNPLALRTTRSKALLAERGDWGVVAENGPGNIKRYVFSTYHDALLFFSRWHGVARILHGPGLEEILSKCGRNPLALKSIRAKIADAASFASVILERPHWRRPADPGQVEARNREPLPVPPENAQISEDASCLVQDVCMLASRLCHVIVSSMAGKVLEFQLSQSSTIRQVKVRVSKAWSIPVSGQRLIFNASVIADRDSLASLLHGDSHLVHLTVLLDYEATLLEKLGLGDLASMEA
mmetsp:Transcript_4622/g.8181  ORF Transcript_4622/g.8181 Transcript_4622/m.8181 type:complete len:293 (-) Transcript_4622:219-1097(-)